MATVLNGTRFLKNTATGNIAATMQAMIDDLSATNYGGMLMIDPVDAADAYQISTPITCKSGVHIIGTPPTLNNPVLVCPDLGPTLLTGTIFEASTSGYSCFIAESVDVSTPTPANAVNDSPQLNLSGLGFKGFTNALHFGAINRIGASFSHWQHIFIEDDAGAGLVMYNPQQMQIDHLKLSKVVRGAEFIVDHATCQPGNSIITGYYCYTNFNTDPDYGLLLEANSRTGYSFAALNFMQFHRPQINCFGGTAGANAGNANLIMRGVQHGAGPTPVVNKCEMLGTDTEGEMDYSLNLDAAKNCHIKISGSATEAQVTNSLLARNCDYTHIDSGEVDFTTDIDNTNTVISCSGYFRTHTDRVPVGVHTIINYKGTSNDVRTVFQPTLATQSQSRALSIDPAANSLLQFDGVGAARPVRVRNTSETLSKDHIGKIIECGNTGAVTFTLPAASTVINGSYTFVKTTTDAFAITLDGNGSETINGSTTNAEMDAQWDTITVHTDGSNWKITAKVIS